MPYLVEVWYYYKMNNGTYAVYLCSCGHQDMVRVECGDEINCAMCGAKEARYVHG